MNTLANIVNKVNCYFIADEDEYIPTSDYIWFYGFYAGMLIIAIIFITLLIFN